MTPLLFAGPVSSANPEGVGSFFSWVFLILGTAVLLHTWIIFHRQRQQNQERQLSKVLFISAVAVVFIVVGIKDLIWLATTVGLDYFGARCYTGTIGWFTSTDEPLLDQAGQPAKLESLLLRPK